jgi:hypothetical protein
MPDPNHPSSNKVAYVHYSRDRSDQHGDFHSVVSRIDHVDHRQGGVIVLFVQNPAVGR